MISKFINKNDNPHKKIAFTLAEVLITLGIIGVVAALTIPTLNKKIQDNIYKSQAKKVYANMTNALRLMQANGEDISQCHYIRKEDGTEINLHAGCSTFFDNFTQKMKLAQKCTGNALEEGCVPKYKFKDEIKSAGCSWYYPEHIESDSTVYVLADGSIVIPFGSVESNYSCSTMLVDINGKKGPNKIGSDVYSLSIYEKQSDIFIEGGSKCIIENDTNKRTINDIIKINPLNR